MLDIREDLHNALQVIDTESYNRVLGRVTCTKEGQLQFHRNSLVLLSQEQEERISWLLLDMEGYYG